MTIEIGQIIQPKIEAVIFGPNCVAERLVGTLEQIGAKKVFLVSTGSMVRGGQFDRVKELIGSRLAGAFTESAPHTPKPVAFAAAEMASKCDTDCVVSLGGSSVVDLSKAIALILAEGTDLEKMRISFSPETGVVMPPLPAPKIPHISIPTTLSGSEFTFAAAITDPEDGEKSLYVDPKLWPKYIFQDGGFCADTPDSLWVETGMKAVSDCIEAITSRAGSSYSEAVGIAALKLLYDNLPFAVGEGDTSSYRRNTMQGAYMALSNAMNASLGLVAGIRHQLGGALGLSHGVASTIVLPHVMRWNAAEASAAMARAAVQLDISSVEDSQEDGAEALVTAISKMISTLNIPANLSDVGVSKEGLHGVANHVVGDFAIANNARPVRSTDDVMQVLEAAF